MFSETGFHLRASASGNTGQVAQQQAARPHLHAKLLSARASAVCSSGVSRMLVAKVAKTFGQPPRPKLLRSKLLASFATLRKSRTANGTSYGWPRRRRSSTQEWSRKIVAQPTRRTRMDNPTGRSIGLIDRGPVLDDQTAHHSRLLLAGAAYRGKCNLFPDGVRFGRPFPFRRELSRGECS